MRTPRLQFDKKRRFYYCRVNGYHYLGKDRKQARRQFVRLLTDSPHIGSPVSVAGLVLAWQKDHPGRWPHDVTRIWAVTQGETLLEDLRPDALEQLVAAMQEHGYAAWTIRHVHAYAYNVLLWAVEKGFIDTAPRRVRRLPRSREAFKDVPPGELKALLANLAKNPNALRVASFILATGCRPGEARLLKWEQVRFDKGICVLSEHKTAARTGEPRTIYLTQDAVKILRATPRTASPYVFLNQRNRPYTKDGLHIAMKRAGLRSPYRLRHTAAQSWLDAGVPLEDVAKLLGHTDAAMRAVRTYAKVRDSRAVSVARHLASPIQLPPGVLSQPKTPDARHGRARAPRHTPAESPQISGFSIVA